MDKKQQLKEVTAKRDDAYKALGVIEFHIREVVAGRVQPARGTIGPILTEADSIKADIEKLDAELYKLMR